MSARERPALLSLFFTLGAAAQTAQILLIRELLSISSGSELSIGVLLAVWMAATAAGSGLGATAAGWLCSARRVAGAYAWGAAGLTALVPLSLWYARGGRGFFDVAVGETLAVGEVLLVAAAAGGAVALCFGWLFPLAVAVAAGAEEGGGARGGGAAGPSHGGRVYALESLGAACAGVLLSAFLVTWVDAFTLALCAMGLHAVAAATALRVRLSSLVLLVPAVAGLALLGAPLLGPLLDAAATERAWERFGAGRFELLEARSSPHGPLAALRSDGQVNLYQAGHLLFSLPDRGEAAPHVHLAMLQHRSPRRVLLLGGAWSGSLKEVLRHAVESVDCIEQDAAVGTLAEPHLAPQDRRALEDPRVRLLVTDGRRFVRRCRERYDLVLLHAPEPATLAANRYFTREFFGEVRKIMAEEGVLALGPLSAHTTYADELLLRRNGILLGTLEERFEEVRITAGSPALFLASRSRGALCLDAAQLLARMRARGLPLVDLFSLVEAFYLEKAEAELRTGRPFDPLAGRAPAIEPAERATGEDPGESDELDSHASRSGAAASWSETLNTDARPVVSLGTIVMGAGLAGDPVGAFLDRLAGWPWLAWALPWILVVAVCFGACGRARPRGRGGMSRAPIGLAILALGFWGAATEWLVLVSFQCSFGALYRWVGALIGLFMVGLATGAWRSGRGGGSDGGGAGRSPPRTSAAECEPAPDEPSPGTAPRPTASRVGPGLPALLVAAAACGFLTAALFPLAPLLGTLRWGLGADALLFLLHALAAFAAGALVGAGFPAVLRAAARAEKGARRQRPRKQAGSAQALVSTTPIPTESIPPECRPAGMFYALDVAGGVLGALLASCIVLPAHGAWALAAVSGAACLAAAAGVSFAAVEPPRAKTWSP